MCFLLLYVLFWHLISLRFTQIALPFFQFLIGQVGPFENQILSTLSSRPVLLKISGNRFLKRISKQSLMICDFIRHIIGPLM